ncbi:MAG: GAF domain-containing protein [Actinobacteria bacterium]|nr:GAF domain-containing protein [Actinomycetota bacterium]
MSSGRPISEDGRSLAVDILTRSRLDILSRISKDDAPSSSFFALLNQTRRRFFNGYLDSLKEAVATGDSTDLLGNETFQSYSQGRDGYSLREVLKVPASVKKALGSIINEMVANKEIDAHAALGAKAALDEILDQAGTIRAESFMQTRDEVIKFYNSYQEEIDRFPSNLAATLDLRTLMRSAVKRCTELLDVGRCAFFTRDLVTDELRLMASNFDHERIFDNAPVKLDESVMTELVKGRKPVIVEGYRRSAPLVTSIMKNMKTKLLLLVPLMVRDRNVGLIMMDNVERPRMFTPVVANLAMRFGDKVAAAMENARLHGSEQQKIKETMALLEVSRLVTTTLDIDTLLARLAQITADVCEVSKCSVYVYVDDAGRFYPAATHGTFTNNEWETGMSEGILPVDMTDEDTEAVMERHEVTITDPEVSPFIPSDRIEETGCRALVLVPIYSRDRVLGLMVLLHHKDRDELEGEDLNLVAAIAAQAAVALENTSLYEDLEMSYFSTVKALARAIEVKDPYTYGHSERVTEYALAIARRLGASDPEIQNIKYAAALHDIGKIGIARKILDKPGALSEEEFVHVKTHPQLGDSIIEPVAFLKAPRSIIMHHHERYDGKGYPDGLAGEEIPLGARILAVADSFEAMMSDRPYRKALQVEEAVKELEVNAGTQFDPIVVRAFIEVLKEGDFQRHSSGDRRETAPRQA